MRLFVAVELAEGVRVHLRQVQERLKPHVRSASWTRLGNLHLTLRFLGETDEGELPRLIEALKQVKPQAPASPLRLRAEAMSFFPPRGLVRIVAAAFGGDVPALRAIYNQVENLCAGLGFAKEGRAYRPHATLARPRVLLADAERGRLEALARAQWPGPDFEVGQFVLMESRQHKEGSEYIPLAHFPIVA